MCLDRINQSAKEMLPSMIGYKAVAMCEPGLYSPINNSLNTRDWFVGIKGGWSAVKVAGMDDIIRCSRAPYRSYLAGVHAYTERSYALRALRQSRIYFCIPTRVVKVYLRGPICAGTQFAPVYDSRPGSTVVYKEMTILEEVGSENE